MDLKILGADKKSFKIKRVSTTQRAIRRQLTQLEMLKNSSKGPAKALKKVKEEKARAVKDKKNVKQKLKRVHRKLSDVLEEHIALISKTDEQRAALESAIIELFRQSTISTANLLDDCKRTIAILQKQLDDQIANSINIPSATSSANRPSNSVRAISTKAKGKPYYDWVRMMYYNQVVCFGMSIPKGSASIDSLFRCIGVRLNPLPSTTEIQRFVDEMGTLALLHVATTAAEAEANGAKLAAGADGTIKNAEKYESHWVALKKHAGVVNY
jgi:hypothetical protein